MKLAGSVALLAAAALCHGQGMGGSAPSVTRASARAKSDLPTPPIDFRDIAASAGLTAPNVYGGIDRKRYILEMTGNGVAVLDYDNDGHRDLFFPGGTRLDASGTRSTHRLYRNGGKANFTDVTASSGIGKAGWGQGACAGDYDNDGHIDLLVTYYGANALYRNLGGRFEDVTAAVGLPVTGSRWSSSCLFVDYDRDGLLDLFITNYVRFDLDRALAPGSSPFCFWKGLAVFCGPRGFPTGANLLYKNEDGARFRDVTAPAGIQVPDLHYTLGATASDFNDDGWPDIYVACDSTPSLLYLNRRDGSFAESAVPAGVAYGDAGQEQGGMGAAAGDYDNDGRPDIVKTNFMGETPSLYRNEGDGFFSDSTFAAGLGVHNAFVGWGVQFLDLDHDGWRDIVMANGHIYPELASAKTTETYAQRKLVYWNLRNGAFRDVTAAAGLGASQPAVSRGLAAADFDGDGSLEIAISNMNAAPSLLRNFASKGNAIIVELVGAKSNRSAIGARVAIHAGGRTLVDEVRSGSSYASQSDLRLHFGLGDASKVERIEVRWPNGGSEQVSAVRANQAVVVREGAGVIRQTPFSAATAR